jgi:hypothetical protein
MYVRKGKVARRAFGGCSDPVADRFPNYLPMRNTLPRRCISTHIIVKPYSQGGYRYDPGRTYMHIAPCHVQYQATSPNESHKEVKPARQKNSTSRVLDLTLSQGTASQHYPRQPLHAIYSLSCLHVTLLPHPTILNMHLGRKHATKTSQNISADRTKTYVARHAKG